MSIKLFYEGAEITFTLMEAQTFLKACNDTLPLCAQVCVKQTESCDHGQGLLWIMWKLLGAVFFF